MTGRAGGAATIQGPYGLAVDGSVLAAAGENRIRLIAASIGTFCGQAMTALPESR
jgi:hypothetical protein